MQKYRMNSEGLKMSYYVKGIKTVGGRGCFKGNVHGKMFEHTKIKVQCVVCGHNFTVTKRKNISEEIVAISNRRRYEYANDELPFIRRFFGEQVRYSFWDKCKQYSSVCPNCSHKEPMFSDFIKTIKEKEFLLPD